MFVRANATLLQHHSIDTCVISACECCNFNIIYVALSYNNRYICMVLLPQQVSRSRRLANTLAGWLTQTAVNAFIDVL